MRELLIATILAALALLDVNLLAVKADVIPLDVACLKGAQAAIIDDSQQSLGIQVAYRKHTHNLLDRKDARQLPLASDLGQSKTLKCSQAHYIAIALQSISKMLELSLCGNRLATEHRLEIPVNILLGELIWKFANVDDCLVESVTVVSDRTLSIVGNSQLALKNGNAIWKSRSLLYRHVGDFLRHKLDRKGGLR